MTEIIGVRFKSVGKIYYFSPGDMTVQPGTKVIVETARGVECGEAVFGNKNVEDEAIVQPLKQIIRIATDDDFRQIERNKLKEQEAFTVCEEKIRKLGLNMSLVEVECTFDNSKLLFYFTAENRVDFRELVKELGRPRHLRQTVLLLKLPRRLPARFDKNGQGAVSVLESHEDIRGLRQAHVLLKIRAGRLRGAFEDYPEDRRYS